MKNNLSLYLIFLLLFLLIACSEKVEPNLFVADNPVATQPNYPFDRYVLMTFDFLEIPEGPMKGGVMGANNTSYFTQMPKGEAVSNIIPNNTLNGGFASSGGGIVAANGLLFRRSNSVSAYSRSNLAVNTLTKLIVPFEGRIRENVLQNLENPGYSWLTSTFALKDKGFGFLLETQFVSEQRGYNAEETNYYVKTFSPDIMSVLSPKIRITRDEAIERVKQFALSLSPEIVASDIKFTAVGRDFLEVHNDKLLVEVEFSSREFNGMDRSVDIKNIFPNVFILSLDTSIDGKLEDITVIKNTGLMGSMTETKQHCHDEKGDLYILCHGGGATGFYLNSVITRIKNEETQIDDNWELRIKDYSNLSAARFNGIFVHDNRIITLMNNQTLASSTKNIDLENVWDYYVIDIDTKQAKKIEGLKSCSAFLSGAQLISEIDGKFLLRYVRTGDDEPYNGYYEYDFATNTAKPVFNVTEGGYVADLKKITVTGPQ